uniref:Uncharacterized protein n=1 Tax=Globodera rostochiensis TaxID=31243 RepID=A0A914H428_GLORO
MSDNTSDEDQQQQMEEIHFDRLDALVDVHFKSREWLLSWVCIRRATDGNGAQIGVKRSGKRFCELVPIPQGPLPSKVIGFEFIQICYIGQTVIEFLQRIRRLFDFSGTDVTICTSDNQSRCWGIIWQNIWPLVNGNICCLSLDFSQFDHLRQISPTVLRDCAKLRSIGSSGLFPEFPAEDNAGASSDQAVAKWLITPRGDGLPKMLRCDFWEGMEGLKGSFVNASEPANFIISIWIDDAELVPSELTNNWTGERLTLRRLNEDNWLLVRCPIVREEDKWTKWEKETIELDWDYQQEWNRIDIDFNDTDIGDGIVDENEGPKPLSVLPPRRTQNVQEAQDACLPVHAQQFLFKQKFAQNLLLPPRRIPPLPLLAPPPHRQASFPRAQYYQLEVLNFEQVQQQMEKRANEIKGQELHLVN